MKKTILALLAIVATLFITSCNDYKAPTSMRQAFSERYPNAVDVEWERKRGHAVADFHIPGQWGEYEAWYTLKGEWVMTKHDIQYSDLPVAVRSAFEQGYGTETPVDDVERLDRSNGSTIYIIEATVVINGLLTDIYLDYDEDGTLLRTSADIEDYDNIYYYLP